MGWSEREHGYQDDAGGGRFRSAMRRVFGDGENPMAWGFTLYRAWGIRVRVHLAFVLYILGTLIFTLPRDAIGPGFVLWGLGGLFALVLLHEYGHCIACRKVGGDADDIMLWPLGGLASCAPPHDWKSNLITTLGGPAVNAVLLAPLGLGVWLATRDLGSVIFNPFDPGSALADLRLPLGEGELVGAQPWWLTALWSAHFANIVLLGFNMLVPMYPMDAARVVQALLWRQQGEDRAMRVTLTVGLVTAVALAVLAIVLNETLLLAIALLGGGVCFFERRRLQFTGGDPLAFPSGPDDDELEAKREAKAEKKTQAEQAEVDRILAKISEEGMESLSGGEKRTLKRATHHRRET